MKRIIPGLFILVSLLVSTALPQDKEYDREAKAAGVSVFKISWSGAFYESRYVRRDFADFTIYVKNTGKKAITAINWDYVLVDSVRGNKLYDHLQFRTDDKKIKPGETKRLRKHIENYYIRDHIGALVEITRVEYEDGSVWVRPTAARK